MKRPYWLLLLTAVITLTSSAAAGGANMNWGKRAGGGVDDQAKAVSVLPDGTAVVTGYFQGTATFGPGEGGETQLTASGGYDVFVAKYNAVGGLVWAKKAGGVSGEYGSAVAALSDSSVVVTGRFMGTATFGKGEGNETELISSGSNDLFVAKYNSDGTLAWAKKAGGLSSDEGHGIVVLSGNSLMLTGQFQGTATFGKGEPGETSLVSAGLTDIFLAKYNSDGTLAWVKKAGGTNWDYGVAIAAFTDGSTAITGNFQGTATFGKGEAGETSLVSEGIPDIFVARYNADGTLTWAKRAGGDRHDYGRGIVALSDGSVVVSGSFLNTATFGQGGPLEVQLTSAGGADIFLARYKASGALRWAKRAGGADWDYAEGLALLAGDAFAVTGYFKGTATFGPGEAGQLQLSAAGGYDAFYAGYNSDGTVSWAKRAGGSEDERGWGVASRFDNAVFVTGDFNGTATLGPGEPKQTALASAGGSDVFVLKTNSPPVVDSYSPATPVTVGTGGTHTFEVWCSDADNDTLSYVWEIDGTSTGDADSTMDYMPTFPDLGAHTIVVKVSDGNGGEASHTWDVTVKLGAPTLIAPSGSIYNIKPTFSWTAVTGAAEYDVRVYKDTGEPVRILTAVGVTSIQYDTVLTLSQAYKWRVRAVTVEGERGLYSGYLNFTPIPLPAPTPIAPSGTIDNIKPTFDWTAVAGAVKYEVRVYKDTDELIRVITVVGATSVEYPLTLVWNQAYKWRVRAVTAEGAKGIYSGYENFTPTVLSAPTPIAPSGTIDNIRPTFSWTAVAGAASYQVRVYKDTDELVRVISTAATSVQCDVDLTIGQAYKWRVRAVSAEGEKGIYSGYLNFTPTVLPAPTPIAPSGPIDDIRPTFSWTAVAGAASYQVRVYKDTDELVRVLSTAATSVQCDVDLTIGQAYKWRVRAVTAEGAKGTYSGYLNFTPALLAAPTPIAPSGTIDNIKPTFDWTAVAGAASYQVRVYKDTDELVRVITVVGATSVEYPLTLVWNQAYKWRVRAVTAEGVKGAYSGYLNFTPVP